MSPYDSLPLYLMRCDTKAAPQRPQSPSQAFNYQLRKAGIGSTEYAVSGCSRLRKQIPKHYINRKNTKQTWISFVSSTWIDLHALTYLHCGFSPTSPVVCRKTLSAIFNFNFTRWCLCVSPRNGLFSPIDGLNSFGTKLKMLQKTRCTRTQYKIYQNTTPNQTH